MFTIKTNTLINDELAMQNLLWILVTIVAMTFTLTLALIYIYRSLDNLSFRKYSISILILTMMGSMLNSIAYFLDTPGGFLDIVISVNISMFEMTVAIVYLLWRTVSGRKVNLGTRFSSLIASLIIWNEVSMGILLFSLAYPEMISGYSGTASAVIPYFLSYSVNTYLFIIPMAFEMSVILILFHRKSENFLFYLVLILMSATAPSISGNYSSVPVGLLVTAFVMIIFMVIFFEKIVRQKHAMREAFKKNLLAIFSILTFMMAGEFLGTVLNYNFAISWSVFALSMTISMFFYFYMTFSAGKEKGKRVGWAKDKKFLFYILLASFIAEWFAGAALSFAIPGYPPDGSRGFIAFSNALGGVNSFNTASSLFDAVYLIGSVTNGYWFLMIMGLEMGSLVIIRTRTLQWKEKKVNLYLALAAFALYTLYYPNFGSAHMYEILPFWANVGSLDSLFPFLLLSLLGSYVLYAVLAVLFGRRSYCSTLCPSAVMYGGTLGQSMISFNYESEFSKKHIGSKFKASLYPVIYNSWILLIVVAAISYFSNGGTTFSAWGVDLSVFYSYFVWNILWYVFFITIPFVGMSPCRRYGWCSTGTFVGFFSRIGLFRLKVKDSHTCVTCKDKPCVSACEVGLGDLPGQFITKGEFRSSKCVGAGSCVIACPYENIYFYDVRTYLKERKLRRKKT